MALFSLLALSLTWASAVFPHGGVEPWVWRICVLALALQTLALQMGRPRYALAPAPSAWVTWPLWLLVGWATLQLVPLPLPLLRLVSPLRAEMAVAVASIASAGTSAPISVAPGATFAHLLRLASYLLTFFLIRELAWSLPKRPWALVAPLIAVASLEAALGLWQSFLQLPDGIARGTYVNRNHFAGLLEMTLPFAVMWAVAVLRRNRHRFHSPAKAAMGACLLLSLAGLMLAVVIASLSRGGFIAVLVALFVMGTLGLGARLGVRGRIGVAMAVAALILVGFVMLPPGRLIVRFATVSSLGDISADVRVAIWSQTQHLIAAFPWTGCGLGGFEQAFQRFRDVAPLNRVEYAHNDYLQVMAELGLPGFLLAAAVALALVTESVRHLSTGGSETRCLALAATGSLAAILVHSLVDFNLYIPGNAMLLCWIAGIVCSLTFFPQTSIPFFRYSTNQGALPCYTDMH